MLDGLIYIVIGMWVVCMRLVSVATLVVGMIEFLELSWMMSVWVLFCLVWVIVWVYLLSVMWLRSLEIWIMLMGVAAVGSVVVMVGDVLNDFISGASRVVSLLRMIVSLRTKCF